MRGKAEFDPLHPRFRDIETFIPGSHYKVNVSWGYLEEALARYFEQGLNIDPDFQRAHVWSYAKQVSYVEFILRGGRSSRQLQFNHANWHTILTPRVDDNFVLVDGKQRLEAVRKFLRNELEAFGCKLHDFSDKLPAMCGPDFVFHVNSLPTKSEVLRWYLQLNSGGVVRTSEELDKVRALLKKEQSNA
jgi:hypothetical protein